MTSCEPLALGIKGQLRPEHEGRALEVDAVAVDLLEHIPQRVDRVRMPRHNGDSRADEGAGTIAGLGLAPGGCYSEDYAYCGPVHGTAPDIAGRHTINPTATMLSAVMMLDYLGLEEDARRLERAVEETYAAGDRLTPDQGGSASSDEFAEAVQSRLEE